MKSHVWIIFTITFGLFVANKLIFRPIVITSTENAILKGLVYSLPNFCEAIMGVIILCNFALMLKERYFIFQDVKSSALCYLATFIAFIYVVSQEFGLHELGGNNIYDPMDVIASILGLAIANQIIVWTGYR